MTTWFSILEMNQDQRQQADPRSRIFAASAADPMKLDKTKGSNLTLESRICCLRHEPNETHEEQRQQSHLGSKQFAASATNSMNKFMAILYAMANLQCMTLMRKSAAHLIIGEKD